MSDRLNAKSGKVAHEIVTDGSVYFGANTDPGNTDESVKFPSAVALVWRWSGDNRFLNRLYDFSRRAMRYVVDNLDADKDGWPEGLGNVEREGMGGEKLDNTVYPIRGLTDLVDMAVYKRDQATVVWARKLLRRLRPAFDKTWWNAASGQYADSLGDNNAQLQQQHWIGVTPMETGLAPRGHANTALDARETDCFSGSLPFNRGLFHTGCTGGPEGKGEKVVFSLNTAIKAVADGEYGRSVAAPLHGRERRRRARRAARRAARDPAVARPEPEHRPLLDVPFDVHEGLGPLRHRVARDRAAARRAAGRRPAQPHGRAEGPGGPGADRGQLDPDRRRGRGRGPCPPRRRHLRDPRDAARRRRPRAADRRHRAAWHQVGPSGWTAGASATTLTATNAGIEVTVRVPKPRGRHLVTVET